MRHQTSAPVPRSGQAHSFGTGLGTRRPGLSLPSVWAVPPIAVLGSPPGRDLGSSGTSLGPPAAAPASPPRLERGPDSGYNLDRRRGRSAQATGVAGGIWRWPAGSFEGRPGRRRPRRARQSSQGDGPVRSPCSPPGADSRSASALVPGLPDSAPGTAPAGPRHGRARDGSPRRSTSPTASIATAATTSRPRSTRTSSRRPRPAPTPTTPASAWPTPGSSSAVTRRPGRPSKPSSRRPRPDHPNVADGHVPRRRDGLPARRPRRRRSGARAVRRRQPRPPPRGDRLVAPRRRLPPARRPPGARQAYEKVLSKPGGQLADRARLGLGPGPRRRRGRPTRRSRSSASWPRRAAPSGRTGPASRSAGSSWRRAGSTRRSRPSRRSRRRRRRARSSPEAKLRRAEALGRLDRRDEAEALLRPLVGSPSPDHRRAGGRRPGRLAARPGQGGRGARRASTTPRPGSPRRRPALAPVPRRRGRAGDGQGSTTPGPGSSRSPRPAPTTRSPTTPCSAPPGSPWRPATSPAAKALAAVAPDEVPADATGWPTPT